jgi:hypothetical protein
MRVRDASGKLSTTLFVVSVKVMLVYETQASTGLGRSGI